jgi:hypothetical protein
VSIFRLPERTYLFEAQSDVFKDTGLTEDNVREQKRLTKAARKHLDEFAKNAAQIRVNAKSPAEMLAEKMRQTQSEIYVEDRKVVCGEPLATIKRRLRLPTDPD